MSIQKKSEYSAFTLTDKEVVDYLERNPEFFMEREATLLKMQIPHTQGTAVSILQYQASRLREQNATLHARLLDLVNVARENDRLNERIHHLTLALLKTTSIDEVIDVLDDLLNKEFHAQWAQVYLFDDNAVGDIRHQHCIISRDEQISSQFENFFKSNRPLCGRLKRQQLEILFGDNADEVHSAVLLPLGNHGRIGMIAIGSEDGHRFHSSMGTIYLNQMAETITHALKRYLSAG